MASQTGDATALLDAPVVRSKPTRRRRGRVAEFLLVGGATPLLFALSWLLRETLGLDTAELAVGFTFFHAAHVLNDPHFSVTYLLFYEDVKARAFGDALSPVNRVRYWLAGLAVPVALAAWCLFALVGRAPETLGLLLQLMFLLVGWHYVKQGFGVMMVLSARRGLRFSQRERWVVLAHCFSGWAYAWANPHTESHVVEVKGVVYTAFGRPLGVEIVALLVLSVSALALVVMLARKRRREGPLPVATPLVALLCSVWAWTIYSGVDPLVRYMVPALHSVQYLYFVWLLKRNEAQERERAPFFEAPTRTRLAMLAASALALGWVFFDGAPELLDATFAPPHDASADSSLGPTPYFAALYAFVNIHHYCMDTVIWRRDNPRTRYLTR